MNDPVYQPPESDISKPRQSFSNHIVIILSTLIDIGGTFLMSVVLGLLLNIFLPTLLDASTQLEPASIINAQGNSLLAAMDFIYRVLGLSISFYAGYFCAKKSATAFAYKNALLTAVCVSVIGILLLGFGNTNLMDKATSITLTILAIVSGTYFYLRRQQGADTN